MNSEDQIIVPQETRFNMNNQFQDIVRQENGWNELWKRDIHPWDQPASSPALVEVIEQKPIAAQIPKSGNVLVPGCGRGVDVFYLGNEHRKAYGLDISPIVIQQCKDIRAEKGISESQAEFLLGDFFKFQIPEGGFQLVYDYTFFCAIQPELRPQWGNRMAELIPKDGVLITLMFPLDNSSTGPPFSVSVEAYHQVLDSNFECLLVDNCTSVKAREGKEKIGVWRRK